MAYGLDEVEGVEIEAFDGKRTYAVIGGMLGGWLVLLLLAAGSTT